MEEIKKENTQKTAENQQKKVIGRPFTGTDDPRRWKEGRPKGVKNFSTLFEKAIKDIAEKLELGEDPDVVEVEIVKRGIKEALAGKYPFYKDLFDRIYGQPRGNIDITSGDEPIIFKIVKKENGNNN